MKKFTTKQIIIFIILFIIAGELVSCINNLWFEYKENMLKIPYKYTVMPFEETYKTVYKLGFGKIYGNKYQSKPIVIFGDSSAYGDGVEENENFSSQLSNYLKRPVYNRAFAGWGIQNTYFQFFQKDFYKEIEEPEYIFVVYTPLSYRDMFAPSRYNSLKYKLLSTRKLKRIPLWVMKLNNSYLVAKINDWVAFKKSENFDKSFDNYEAYLLESKKESDKHWKNTKWVILKYIDKTDNDDVKRWEELSKKGFIVINTTDLIGNYFSKNTQYYLSKKNSHPTAKTWHDIIPKLSKRLNLV